MEIRKALIVGHGSIGIRHLTMFNTVFDSKIEIGVLRKKTKNPFQFVRYFYKKEEAIRWNPDVVIVASPSNTHSEYIESFNSKHLLIEKPCILDSNDLSLLTNHNTNKVLKVGYNYRYHPEFKRLKQYVRENNIVEFQLYHSDYLPNWHPWEDYKDSDVARDGVGFTLCHGLDVILETLGNDFIKSLKIKNESNLDLSTSTRMIGESKSGDIKINFDIRCDDQKNSHFFVLIKDSLGSTIKFDFNDKSYVRNNTFIEQMKDFQMNIKMKNEFAQSIQEECNRAEEIIKICQM